MRSDLYQDLYDKEQSYWWHRAKRDLVRQFLPSQKKIKFLDIGCGAGKLMEEMQIRGEVWGIDQSQAAVDFCHQRGLHNVHMGKFPQIKLLPRNFDVITCLDVLEHIQADGEAIKKIASLLKPGGRLIITVPAYQWLFSYWDQILHHVRRYEKAELVKKITAQGLTIKKCSFVYAFLLPVVIPFRLIRGQRFKNKKPQSDFIDLPKFMHTCLSMFAGLERALLSLINLPCGLSIVCVAQKP